MIAYFDCFSGISGDMIVGSLLDAGVPFDWLSGELGRLPLNGYRLQVNDAERGGIRGKRFKVEAEAEAERQRGLSLFTGRAERSRRIGTVPGNERHLGDIKAVIEESTLPSDVKGLSIKVFERLAEAEARIHGIGVDDVHFHEVGAVDSIIDIVSASLSLHYLGIEEVYASEIPFSQGEVSCSHGILPLPAPAAVELLKGIPVYQSPVKGELVTPTGAAFLAVTSKGFGVIPPMRLKGIGYGAGERENEGLPNLLRVMIGERSAGCGVRSAELNPTLTPTLSLREREKGEGALESDTVSVIEANIDDMNPELYSFVMERLFEEGALDASLTPVYMKKGRPGTLIRVICQLGREGEMADILLKETSTIGVRFYRAGRFKLPRESVEVQTIYGKVGLKVTRAPWGDKAQPEYDDCRDVAMEKGVPIREVYREAIKAFERGYV